MIHGWQGSKAPHWQAWLHEKLNTQNIVSSFPQLSDDMHPSKEVWLNEVQKAFTAVDPDTVITHSLGAMVWFHLCNEQRVQKVKKLLIVAPPRDLSAIEELKSFFPVKIPTNTFAEEITLISSSNDIYMDTNEAQALSIKLNAKHSVLENAGHINADSDFGAWPWVLDYVKGSL